jgi:hypothetical protein
MKRRFLVFGLFGVLVLALFYFLGPRKWDGVSRFSVVSQDDRGDVKVVVYDPPSFSITTIFIPGDVQTQAASGLGTWRLRSITRLGKEKNLGLDFLKNTVIKSFGFPIDLATDSSRSGLSLLDRISIFIFSLQVPATGRHEVDLAKTNMLSKGRLADGSDGYLIADKVTAEIKSYFAGGKTLNVSVGNFILGKGQAVMVSRVLDTFGMNVVAIQDNQPKEDLDCRVIGLDDGVVSEISRVLGCESVIKAAPNNFDLVVEIGERFKNRF